MKLPDYTFIILLLTISLNCFSQQDTIRPIIVELKPVTTVGIVTSRAKVATKAQPELPLVYLSHWQSKYTLGLDLNEIAFVNWNAGGTSSISGLLKGNFLRIHTRDKTEWVNELIVRYGINKQDGLAIQKSDDEFRFNSTFGYRKDTLTNWYHSAKFNFNTQFTNGYKYPNTDTPISRLFAPAYTFLGYGVNYFDKVKKFDVYVSPLTFKNTLVLDQNLANKGAFGVTKAIYDVDGNLISEGKKSRTEIGFLVTNYYKKEVWKNVVIENRLSLYSDYINKFGNIDVEWRLNFDLVVNRYVRANIGTHLIYDDDIKTTEEINGTQVQKGAKVQLKQVLGIGLVYVI